MYLRYYRCRAEAQAFVLCVVLDLFPLCAKHPVGEKPDSRVSDPSQEFVEVRTAARLPRRSDRRRCTRRCVQPRIGRFTQELEEVDARCSPGLKGGIRHVVSPLFRRRGVVLFLLSCLVAGEESHLEYGPGLIRLDCAYWFIGVRGRG